VLQVDCFPLECHGSCCSWLHEKFESAFMPMILQRVCDGALVSGSHVIIVSELKAIMEYWNKIPLLALVLRSEALCYNLTVSLYLRDMDSFP
jgi:hypothetical protein